jgi:hypothetical protein
MARFSPRLDHCHRHPGVLGPLERELTQGDPDATLLVDGQQGDLTHAALGIIDLDSHEAGGPRVLSQSLGALA